MKTADLIPFILLELAECDKYGFELTKNIETKSKGLVVIKQPTLYTVLKKLEKSKFISSYWEDSEIGGKRHYYKLTENGKLQVSTLPSYEALINNLSSDEESLSDSISSNDTKEITNVVESKKSVEDTSTRISIMDALLDNSNPTPVETILPTEEVFADNSLDNATELSINSSNTEILQSETDKKHELFATNTDVSKFTEQVKSEISEDVKHKINDSTEKIDILHVPTSFTTRVVNDNIKYVDYVDIKSSKTYKLSKKITKNMLIRTICSSMYILMAVILSTLATTRTGSSPLFNIFLIAGVIGAIFYPLIFIFIMEKFRLNVQEYDFKANLKLNFFIAVGIFLFVLVLCIFVNIAIGNGSIIKLFAVGNFANFYGPLFISSSVFADYLFNYIFLKKMLK